MFLTRFRKKAAEEKDISRVSKWKEMYEGRSESGVTIVLVEAAVERSAEGTESCFSQPERVKSADIQRIKILKYLQIGG